MEKREVLIVEDDVAVRDSLLMLLTSEGFAVQPYSSVERFLSSALPAKACIISDIKFSGMSGLDLLDELNRRNSHLPVIIITGHGDVPLAVRAMKAGAFEFIEKPVDPEALLRGVAAALTQAAYVHNHYAEIHAARALLETLTPRERQILDILTLGSSNKEAAAQLGISPRTVEIHRAHLVKKLRTKSLSSLVRLVMNAAISP